MKQLPLVLLSSLGLLAAACSDVPKEAYFNRGTPESLLDASSEVVTVDLESDLSLNELIRWINQDQPTRAELYCSGGELCAKAEDILNVNGVDYQPMETDEQSVHLIYERVLARDCENRFIDNHINPYALNHPSFGCSVASNMVQMVSDKRQFVSPALLDYHDAEKAAQTYNDKYRYFDPNEAFQSGDNFGISDLSTQ